MGLFDFLKRKSTPVVKQVAPTPPPPKATPSPPPPKAVEPSQPSELSWSVWPAKVEDVVAELAHEHAFARARGLRMIAYSYEAWSPGSVAFKKFREHPLAKTVLHNIHVVEFGMDAMDKLKETGVRAIYIPQLWAFDSEGKIAENSISGAYWGADTPENIAKALPRWFENLKQSAWRQ
jgi:hypothetical protein